MKIKALIVFSFALCGISQGFGQTVLRVGAFPNITHPQAMVGKANRWFEKAMGTNVKIEWKSFNAGPSAIEARFAGAIDMAYIGPNPTISGYVRSQGEALKVISGAASGGASLVVRNNARRLSRKAGRVAPAWQYTRRCPARLAQGARDEGAR